MIAAVAKRKSRSVAPLAAVICLVVGLALAARLAIDDFVGQPTLSEVAIRAQQEPDIPAAEAVAREVEGVGFPDWTRWGWEPVGGRSDDLADDGRRMETVVYRKGKRRIAYSIVSGTGDVNSDLGMRSVTRTPPEGKVGLDVSGLTVDSTIEVDGARGQCDGPCRLYSGSVNIVKRTIDDHRVILTAGPASDELSQEAQDMALRTKR